MGSGGRHRDVRVPSVLALNQGRRTRSSVIQGTRAVEGARARGKQTRSIGNCPGDGLDGAAATPWLKNLSPMGVTGMKGDRVRGSEWTLQVGDETWGDDQEMR
jgi:hypothetical protein